MLIVKPVDGTRKDVLVNPDGSAITWIADSNNGGQNTPGVRKGRDENGNDIWGEMADGTPASFTGVGGRIYRETQVSDNAYKTGNRLQYDREPVKGAIEANQLTDDLTGYNYIAFSGGASNVTVTLTVNCDADVIYVAQNASPGAGWTEITDGKQDFVGAKGESLTGFGTYRRQNPMSLWNVAYLVYELGYDFGDFYLHGGGNTLSLIHI